MRSVFVILSLCCLVSGLTSPVHDEKYIETINAKSISWKAGINDRFFGMSEVELKQEFQGCHNKAQEKSLGSNPFIDLDVAALPVNFTSSLNWPHCKTIGHIYNQARCGSCWAFGGVEAFQDRMCIASNGKINEAMSFADVTECDDYSDGCEGGSAGSTWNFIQENGIVTDACYPYYIPTCPESQQPCLNFVSTPSCWGNNSCVDGSPWKTYTVSTAFDINSVEDAMKEIYTNGPIEACFEVYSDFVHYKSGVYVHTHGSFLGGHCIKISGWGVEGSIPYWLVNNSWTTGWGDKGYFKIKRGVDMCGIEDDMVAGTPQVS